MRANAWEGSGPWLEKPEMPTALITTLPFIPLCPWPRTEQPTGGCMTTRTTRGALLSCQDFSPIAGGKGVGGRERHPYYGCIRFACACTLHEWPLGDDALLLWCSRRERERGLDWATMSNR